MADATIQPGDKLQLNFDVENRGTRRGSETVELLLDDTVVDEAAIVLDSTETGQLVLETDAFSDDDDGDVFVVETVIGTRKEATFEVEVVAIPDTVVSRPQDDTSVVRDAQRGISFVPKENFSEVGFRVSDNSSGFTTAYIYDLSDDSLLKSLDVSDLSAGDTFTIESNYQADTEYSIALDADGSDYTVGYYEGEGYPYTSDDIDITGGITNGTDDATYPYCIVEIGNVGFD